MENTGKKCRWAVKALLAILWLTQSLRFVELVTNKGLPVGLFVTMTSLLMPRLFSLLSPIAMFAATLFVYNRMLSDRELVVMKAAGISPWKSAIPVLYFGIIMTLVNLYVNIWGIPQAEAAFTELEWKVKNDVSHLMFREGQFTEVQPGLTVFITTHEKDGSVTGIMVNDERTPGFNLMSVKGLFRRGDRSRGLDDRFLFLEALLSARKSIYFSYIGQSPVDRKELNPSVVLTELMDYVCDNFTLEGLDSDKKIRAAAVKERIWCLEHMNSYHEDNFITHDEAGKMPKIPSFDESSLVIPSVDKRERVFLGDKKEYAARSEFSDKVLLSDFLSFLSNSSRYFLHDVLDISLDDYQNDDLSEVESFSLGFLERGSLIESLVYSDENEGKDFLENLKEKGQLPCGIFG